MKEPDHVKLGADEQLPLIDLGPIVGERWQNRHTGTIVAVHGVEQRKYGWVTIRVYGNLQTIAIAKLLDNFERYRK
jgi:hypothetical protein